MTTQAELDLAAAAQAQARDAGVAKARAAHSAGIDAAYTAQPGDTLESIATAVYDDVDVAELLWQANTAVIGADPANLTAGTPLVLPAN